ncbi:izumo sperm-egg fusion protein 1-like isoform X2 [Crocuta crocuta]
MGPQLALLVGVLSGYLLPARGCIICDRRVVAALDSLDKDYLPTHVAPERHREVMRMINESVRNFTILSDVKAKFIGIVDEATMESSVLSFVRRLRLITNRGVTGDAFLKEFIEMVTQEKTTFLQSIAELQKRGVMLQYLFWCHICRKRHYLCQKSIKCGVRQISVHEKEDMILDCELDWHKLSEGLTNYSFYRVWGRNSETLVYKGKRPTLTKPLVMPEDAGNYRCELGTEQHGPASIIHFEVTVLPQRIIAETMSKTSTMAQTMSKTSTIAQTMSKSSNIAPEMSKSSTMAQTMSESSSIAPEMSKSSTMAQTMSESSSIAPEMSKSSTMAQTMSESSSIAPEMSKSSTMAQTMSESSSIALEMSKSSTMAQTMFESSTIVISPSTIGSQSSTNGTQTGNWHDLSSTLKPSESPKSEHVPRGRVVGLLIWGCVVLIIGLLTIALCYRPEKVMDSVNSRFPTYKRGVP